MTAEERANATKDLLKAELTLLVRKREYASEAHAVMQGFLELAVAMMLVGVQREPGAMPVLLGQIDRARALVVAAGEPATTMH